MNRVCNFSAGPSTLPEWVLKEAADNMLNFRGSGKPVTEMSHRLSEFVAVMEDAHRRLLNLMTKSRKSNHITTGQWSVNALAKGKKEVASSADENFSYISNLKDIEFDLDADYVHITLNNTIYATAYKKLPSTRNDDLISVIESKKVEEYVTDFAYEELMGEEDAVTFPNPYTSTPETEDNYTSMANSIVVNYLKLWIIHNIISRIFAKLLEYE